MTKVSTYNLYDIVKCVLKSKSPKEYIKKVKAKEFLHGFYLIKKDDIIDILEKTKVLAGKNLLNDIIKNKKTGYELSREELVEKYKKSQVNYFDIGSQLINYEECKIRYLYDNKANIYFRAKDICQTLGYADTSKSLRDHIKEEDRINFSNINSLNSSPTLGNEKEDKKTIYINETGLYTLMLSSQQKQAVKFKDWICRDVLPSIRKQGFYTLHKTFNLNDYDMKNCLYIFKGSGPYYKVGITKDIKRRMSGHKSVGLLKDTNQICNIFVLDNYNKLMNLEKDVKEFIRNNGHLYEFKNYTELFKEESFEIVLGEIKDLVNKSNLRKELNFTQTASQTSIEILKLQNEKIDKELELEKVKLEQIREEKLKVEREIELEKLKQEKKAIVNKVNKVINNNNKTINNITNVIKKDVKDGKKCVDCENIIKKKSTRCLKCENKYRFLQGNGNRPKFEQLLKDKIELGSYTKIGRKYDVSDNAVRKWFKTFEKYGYKFQINTENI